MKNLLIINIHSFVDVITNSSSELFVCDYTKSIKAVRTAIENLANTDEDCKNKFIFSDIFKEPIKCKYTFVYTDFPAILREEYEKYNVAYQYGHYNEGYHQSYRYQNIRKEQEDLGRFKHDLAKIHDLYTKGKTDEYNRLNALYQADLETVWHSWNIDSCKSEMALFIEFLKINKLNKHIKTVEKLVADAINNTPFVNPFGWQVPTDKRKKPLYDIYHENFRFYINCGVSLHKGDIMIWSADDNSVPWNLMDTIEATLPAKRYHI